jgi:hypothetical protein
MLLAIDPGLDTGWALFSSAAQLVACGLGDPRMSDRHRVADLRTVVIEQPFVYPRGQTKNPNDVITLALNAGEWGGLYRQWADVKYVLPFKWKGSVPKRISHVRILGKLSDRERTVVDTAMALGRSCAPKALGRPIARSLQHNVLDAVGLGLFAVSR